MPESGQSPLVSEPRFSLGDVRAIERVQWFTVVWMCLEVGVSLFTAIRARSVALAAFGADSAIELLSAATVVWRFSTGRRHPEATTTKITGWLLIALVFYIATSALYALILHRKAEVSYLGMIVLVAAALIMPWLGTQKRRLAIAANSAALRADAAQSSVCGYLAWIALAGLLLNTFAHLWWADAVAAFCLIPLVLKEAKEAFEGHTCDCG